MKSRDKRRIRDDTVQNNTYYKRSIWMRMEKCTNFRI